MSKAKPSLRSKALIALVIVLSVIILCIGINMLTKNKLSDYITLTVLYLTNKEEVKFSDMVLYVPFDYFREKSRGKLVLIKFPKGGDIITITKGRYVPKDQFQERFREYFKKVDYTPIYENVLNIGKARGYIISACSKSDPWECEAYITVPQRQVTISFVGNRGHLQGFRKMMKEIEFAAEAIAR
ncbi:MAG: hypothetical protein JRF50_07530 [Deltaproteobacteria bacterium]|nr:hypothetical protein [Deltaproteobacteria bacterium]